MQSVGEKFTRRLLIAVAVAVLAVIASLGGLLFAVGARHNRSIEDEAHAIDVIRSINQAQAVLAAQNDIVMASPHLPLDRTRLEANDREFRRLMANPRLARTPAGRQLQARVLAADRAFIAAAKALPPRPSVSQAIALDAQRDQLSRLVNDLAAVHSASLTAVVATERQQRELTALAFAVFASATVVLVAIGFVLLTRLGEQRAHARALEATDQLRNELVSFAAHELRNPATTISAGVYLLRRPETDPETRDRALDSMAESAAALGRLVMNLLNMGRVEEGKLHLHRERVALPQLVGEVVDEMSTYYRDLRARTDINLSDVQIEVDKDYLRLVLSNVLSNALKYAPADSHISISGEVEGPMAAVQVHDEGPGISEEILPHIFEKYETGGDGLPGPRRGVGLGLYMARLLVEAHGGRIWADSGPERGTTISFTLPLAQSADEGAQQETDHRRAA